MTRSMFTLAACTLAAAALPGAALAAPAKLAATLAGTNETAGGDPDGTGAFAAEVDTETGDVCFTLTVAKIGAPIAAHIHKGAAGADGDPVATISVTGNDGDECIAAEPALLKEIVAAPASYYVNVHSAEFPKGAVRGQLGPGK
ncbi:CHRD domain-containing protein [Novosphingobium album (ex Liu et al. 2023)]|uniref:CHRD domain-containing protein n=1 Tax=Novosphingobium album (ex Liu et al. 2023) TaxID=3031130 RepID=A0ABT5WJW1_9SPHN|nr:CHRD domain-containing protein [Novosphingobium album (ex Liu et al. 2023)]MDE8650311.1 CHRD domain-containing protein [Novosphingobium album (ex Liu et al. 2023)]